MSQRILDEREHRRGLVLGLTLAEILILLLFLLLLALGVRLTKLEQEKKSVEKEVKVVLDEIKRRLPEGTEHPDERAMKEFATKLNRIMRLEKRFPALVDKFDIVEDLIEAGVDVDPNDPPAAIEEARNILRMHGSGAKSAQIAAVEKKVAELEAKLPHTANDGSPKKSTLAERMMTILKQMDPIIAEMWDSGIKTGSVPGKKGAHDWPPIITLSEARGYSFATGSADVTPDFQVRLSTEVVERLLQTISEYGVDVIEVVGHTDERPFNVRQAKLEPAPDSTPSTPRLRLIRRPSNLDTALIPFLKGDSERLTPVDNAGLGLARAASVARILAKEPALANVRILPLSGGQLVQVGDILSPGSPGDARERRRIEIRARRSDKSAHPWEGRVSQDPPLAPAK